MATYRRYLIKPGVNETITVDVSAIVPRPLGCLLVASQAGDLRGVVPDDESLAPWDVTAFVTLQDALAFEGIGARIGVGAVRVRPFRQASKYLALLSWPSLFLEDAPKEFNFAFASCLGPRHVVHSKIWVWAVPLADLATTVEIPGLYDLQRVALPCDPPRGVVVDCVVTQPKEIHPPGKSR